MHIAIHLRLGEFGGFLGAERNVEVAMSTPRPPIPASVQCMVTGNLIDTARFTIHAGSCDRIGVFVQRSGAAGRVQITSDLRRASSERARDLINYALARAFDQLVTCWHCSTCMPIDGETQHLLENSPLFAHLVQYEGHSATHPETPAT